MSDVTFVSASAKALFGSLTAPMRSAFIESCSLIFGFFLSSVPDDVMKATIPPGATLSSALRKKASCISKSLV